MHFIASVHLVSALMAEQSSNGRTHAQTDTQTLPKISICYMWAFSCQMILVEQLGPRAAYIGSVYTIHTSLC